MAVLSMENFTCSALDLSRDSATEEVWTLQTEDRAHLDSVRSIAAFQIIYLVVGIPWNLLVIGVLLKKLFSKPTHLLLLNLALSDLLVCVCVMPFNIITGLAGRFFIGSSDYARCQVCHFYVITIIIMIYSSLFTVAIMSIDRLIYIKLPLRYNKIITVKKMFFLLVLTWVLSIFIGLPPVFGFGEIRFSNIVGSCTNIFSARTRLGESMNYIIFLVLVALVPFITTLVCNIWLLSIACRTVKLRYAKSVRNLNSDQHVSRMKSKHNQQQIRLAQVFGAIFVVNIMTWLPTAAISVLSGVLGSENVPPEAFSFVFLAFLSQPAIHPILETFLVARVRNLFLKYIRCCRYKASPETMETQTEYTK